ncbi:MAG: hypothetical protein AAF658_15680 [Myxococcota bacterium]
MEVLDFLMKPVDAFIEDPMIDETFDPAFAALALMVEVIRKTGPVPWKNGAVLNATPIAEAMLQCFDSEIDSLEPDADYKTQQRTALARCHEEFKNLLSQA